MTELQNPDFIFSTDSLEEKLAFIKYISNLTGRRIILLDDDIFILPFVVSSLKESNIETILKEGGYNLKKILFSNLSNPDFLKQVSEFINEIDRREKTTENSTRFKNILQYLRDNRFIV